MFSSFGSFAYCCTRLFSLSLCYARAPLLISRPVPSASSGPATLVYIWRRGSQAYVRSFNAAVASLQVIEVFACRNLVFKVTTRKQKKTMTHALTHSGPDRDSSADSAMHRSRSAGPAASERNDMATAQQLLQAMQQMQQQNQQAY